MKPKSTVLPLPRFSSFARLVTPPAHLHGAGLDAYGWCRGPLLLPASLCGLREHIVFFPTMIDERPRPDLS
jgi:hypothetical protein